MSPETYGPLIGVGVALVVILLRNRKPRPLHVRWMWVRPAIIVPLIGLGLWASAAAPGAPHIRWSVVSVLILLAGLGLGVLAGWNRGKSITIERHADGSLKAQASPLGLILIVVLLLGRRLLAAWLEPHAGDWGVDPVAVADAFLLFAAAMIVTQSLEMFIRARRIQKGEPDAHVADEP